MFFTSVTNWVVFGTSALLPGYLQRVMGYSVIDTGLLMIPRGVGMLIAMAILSRLPVSRNPLLFIAFGFILVAYSLSMMGNYNVQLNSDYIVWTGILQGIGTSFVFMPTNVLCYLTLPAHLQTDAASSLGLIRNLSGSIGISTIFTVFARDNQMFHALLAETITPTRVIVGWPDLLSLQSTQGAWILNQELTRQATMQSYLNIFIVMEWMALAIGLVVALALFRRMLTR
jgi:DHA2 family multidrug resistance protein